MKQKKMIWMAALALALAVQSVGAESLFPAGENSLSIELITPKPQHLQVARKPVLRFTYKGSEKPDALRVLLDGNDISELVVWDKDGFSCRLLEPLSAGDHTLSVSARADTEEFSDEFNFSSHQYAWLDEFASSNTLTINAGAVLAEKNMAETDPYTKVDATLNHELKIKKGNWHLEVSADGRYLEQDTGLESPEKKGPDLVTFLLATGYENENNSMNIRIGDLDIEQSPNTFTSLSRNGGQVELQSHGFSLGGFAVFGRETFGLHEGFGIGFDDKSNIVGGHAGVDLFEDRLRLKVFYATGGREGDSFSNWTDEPGGSSGDIGGGLVEAVLVPDLLNLEMEYDMSNYDPNDRDEFGGDDDEAWRIATSGVYDIYEYELVYEYFGGRYQVVGNEGARKDYKGVTATGTSSWAVHYLSLSFSAYRDNVDDDPLTQVVHSLSGTAEYEYSGLEQFPLRLRFEHTRDRSSDEPEDDTEQDIFTELFGATLSYEGNITAIELNTEYSWQDDRTREDQDKAGLTIGISPSLTLDSFNARLGLSLNRDRDYGSAGRNDTYTITLDIQGDTLSSQVSYELGGTYDRNLSSDNSMDEYSTSGYCRLAYYPELGVFEGYHPSIGFEMQYSRQTDRLEDRFTEDSRVMLTLSTEISFNL